MPQRDKRHPERPGRFRRGVRRWPEVLAVVLVVAAAAQLTYRVVDELTGTAPIPAAIAPPAGLVLPPSVEAPPVATTSVVSETGGRLDPALVAAAVTPYVAGLGPHATVVVGDLVTGAVAYTYGAQAVIPASTMKLLTAAAALSSLGPMTRFTTSVHLDGDQLVLVGGGDPFLMSDQKKARGLYPARADLDSLAVRTATALASRGVASVRLRFDASRFTGPAVSPTWPASYLTEDVVPRITALWVDEAEGSDGRYVAKPALRAAQVFAAALARHGITVTGPVAAGRAGSEAVEVAQALSAPVGEIVERTLAVSDNNAAEVLAHQVGLEVLGEGSFAGGAAGVEKVLGDLGVPLAGTRIFDGSGLSRENLLTPEVLLAVLGLGGSDAQPGLRQVLTGLPVAGFSGSLQWRFEEGPAEAKGRVRAKTGTLTGVSGLAGVATDLNDNRMSFVAIADGFDPGQTLAVRKTLDRIAAALGACHCSP